MKTIVLPGYSVGNRDWAYQIKQSLNIGQEILVHEWRHWNPKIAKGLSEALEMDKIIEEIGIDDVNVIAKSVGTRILMKLMPKIVNKVTRVILCGIPTKGETPQSQELYREGLSLIGAKDVVVFQNTQDPFCPFVFCERLIHGINPNIQLIEKSRRDHNYPYFKDFEDFLKTG
jgi:hypothetical protein